MSKKKILLIDGFSVAFRAFYGLHSQMNSMLNKNGLHTNAIYGFNSMLESIMNKEKPTHVLVAFDAGKTTFRHELFSDYKGGREGMPPEFAEQVPYIKEMIKAYGVAMYELPNYEADDIIGTLARIAEQDKDNEVVILTGDRDLTQLAADNVRVSITKKGVSDIQDVTPESLMDELGITPAQVVDMKALAGDKSDNIPGVSGIGDGWAVKFLKEFNTIEELYDRIEEVTQKKKYESLTAEKETAFLSKELATINTQSPIEITIDDLEYIGYDVEELVMFYLDMDFNSHIAKLGDNGELDGIDLSALTGQADYEVVDEITPDMLKDDAALYIEFFEADYLHADFLAVAWGDDQQIYVTTPEVALNSDIFKDWLEDETKSIKTNDIKATLVALHTRGIDLTNVTFDLSLASYLLTAEDSSSGNVSEIALKHEYDGVMSDIFVYGKGKKQSVPENPNQMYAHVASKTKAIYELSDQLGRELHENKQDELFYEIELPLAKVLGDMEIQGITLDVKRLEDMKTEFDEVLAGLEEKVYELAGETFNMNSPSQLSEILFEKMGYKPLKKTSVSKKPSTAQSVLEKMQSYAPIVKYILEYRSIAKLQSTYIEGLMKVADKETSKVHTRYLQTVARTGRLSSVDPNLQNIPIRTEEGRKIRQAFVPRQEGWKILAADYSQIELRVLAHFSKDEALVDTYKHDKDVHTTTAMKVFHVDNPSEVTPNMRRDAKAVNFGIVYGISDYGLSQNLNISVPEAKDFIKTYFKQFPGVDEFLDRVVREAKNDGYIETIFKRRRYVPDINHTKKNIREFAERVAMNTPIQGSAADIIKVAMIRMAKRLEEEQLEATMLLQVHDELIFEVPEAEIPKLQALVEEVMENAVELAVPLKVDCDYGDTWYDAK